MPYDPARHHRRSIRLRDYDYAQAGVYFVTIVTKNRITVFEQTATKAIVEETWEWLADRYHHVDLDEYIVMPNHLHGIVVIRSVGRGGSRTAPTASIKRKAPGRLIGAFKTVSTKQINLLQGTAGGAVWQRNFYERIVRDQDELNRIRQYIGNNTVAWETDPENHRSKELLGTVPAAIIPRST